MRHFVPYKGLHPLQRLRVYPSALCSRNSLLAQTISFDFKPVDVAANDSRKRIAMTQEQQMPWMDFIQEDNIYCKYYDEFVVLMGT